MLLAQLMVTTISRSKRSQRVATAGRCPSGPAGSGMAYSFSGSTTSRWDTSAFTGAAVTVGRGTGIDQPAGPLGSSIFPELVPPWPSSTATGQQAQKSLGRTLPVSQGKPVCGQVLRVRQPFPVPGCTQGLTQKKVFSEYFLGEMSK